MLADAGIQTWATAAYTGPVQRAIVAWKVGNRVDLGEPLLGVMAAAAAAVVQLLAAGSAAGGASLLLVPAPSGWRRRWTGRFVVGDLAVAAAGGAAHTGTAASAVDVLSRSGRSQHTLTAGGRRQASLRSIRAKGALPAGAPVLLIDDVLTTGATLAASAAAVRRAGGRVIAALVLAATPAPTAKNIGADRKEMVRKPWPVD